MYVQCSIIFFMHGPENIDKRVTLYTQLKFCMRFVLSYI